MKRRYGVTGCESFILLYPSQIIAGEPFTTGISRNTMAGSIYP
jgi:hypothetical protein